MSESLIVHRSGLTKVIASVVLGNLKVADKVMVGGNEEIFLKTLAEREL